MAQNQKSVTNVTKVSSIPIVSIPLLAKVATLNKGEGKELAKLIRLEATASRTPGDSWVPAKGINTPRLPHLRGED